MEKQAPQPTEDSLKKRYIYRVFSNVLSFIIGLATIGIVPRSLGAASYGDYQFLKSHFESFHGFFDLGMSTCFQVKYSARPDEKRLSAFFFKYLLLSVLAMLGVVVAVFTLSLGGKMWPGQEMYFVFMALGMAVLIKVSRILLMMADAHGLTVKTELSRIALGFIVTILLLLLYHYKLITLRNYFIFQYFNFGMLCLLLYGLLMRAGKTIGFSSRLGGETIKKYSREFFTYVHPLITFQVIGSGSLLVQRWMLQWFGGSAQQGFYGLSYNVSMVCGMFSASMASLITREFSVAYQAGNIEKMAAIFRRYIPMLFSITAYFSCFICIQADLIVSIIGGEQYEDAMAPIRLMALFPLTQTYGQLSGAVLYASGRTKLHRNIGTTGLVAGLVATWFLLAPPEMMGLDAGAIGLAVRMVAGGFLVVNVQLYYNSKFLHIPFMWYILHQFLSVGFFLVLTMAVRHFSMLALGHAADNILILFVFSGAAYTLLAAISFYMFPQIFGLGRNDVQELLNRIRDFLTRKK